MLASPPRNLILGVLAFVLVVGAAEVASAQTCSFSITNVNFGNIDVTANTVFDTTATFSANCSGIAGRRVRVCPSFGLGTGGSITGNPRFLLSGTNLLNFNLYSNSARTTVWGSYFWGFVFTPPTINIRLNSSGLGSSTRTIYARVNAAQQTKPAGTYVSAFIGTNTAIAYAYSTVGNCAVIGGINSTQAPFTVTATNVTTCSLTATNVDFGTTGVLQAALDATGTLSVTCTASAPYNIGLNAGTGSGATVAVRLMTLSGATIRYSLYTTAARTTVWGNTVGTDTVAGTGTGTAQTITVYGRIPAQTTPAPGTYTDTIVATVTY